MSQLANQIAVVTGAGRGIGRAIALKFANEGADVVVVSRTQENSEKVAAEIRALGRKAWAFAVDVADAAAVNTAAEKILRRNDQGGHSREQCRMRDARRFAHAHGGRGLGRGAEHKFEGRFSRHEGVQPRDDQGAHGAHHQHLIGHRSHRQRGPVQLRGEQGGLDRLHAVGGEGTRGTRHHGQRHRARLHPDGHDVGVEGRNEDGVAQADSARQLWRGGGHCGRGVVSGQPGGALRYRSSADGGRRNGDENGISRFILNGWSGGRAGLRPRKFWFRA